MLVSSRAEVNPGGGSLAFHGAGSLAYLRVWAATGPLWRGTRIALGSAGHDHATAYRSVTSRPTG